LTKNLQKQRWGDIYLPSNLNGIIGITSYYCVILKIMILHDAIKTSKNKVFPFSLKKERNLVSFFKKKQKKWGFLKKNKWDVFFERKRVFLNLVTYPTTLTSCKTSGPQHVLYYLMWSSDKKVWRAVI